jgi:hypothetical protein
VRGFSKAAKEADTPKSLNREGRIVRREQDGPERYQDPPGYHNRPATTPGTATDDFDALGYPPLRTPTSAPPPAEDEATDARFEPASEPREGGGGAYWAGLIILMVGLVATVAALATHVTSIVQTVLLAAPLLAVGIGLERIGRGVRRGSLRLIGALLIVIAVASPVVLTVSSPGRSFDATASAPVPAGANSAVLRTSEGGGQLRVDSGAVGLYQAELRTPGKPTAEVSTSGKLAVVDLRGPAQRGLLARNRGSDWAVRLNSSIPWRVEAEVGALTGDLDLRQVDVSGVDVQAGISRLAVRLNQPTNQVPVNLQISAGLIDLYLPRSAAVAVRVKGPAVNNFGSQGLTNRDGAWRSTGTTGGGSFNISVRLTAGRVRVHRV